MRRLPLILFLILLSTGLFSQQYTLSGYVKDGASGEVLLGARIFEPTLQIGTLSNEYGFFSLTLPSEPVQLVFSYVGYKRDTLNFHLQADSTLNLELQPTMMDDIVIEANSPTEILNSSQMSVNQISGVEAKTIPSIFGEPDILKAFQLMPGVQSGGEGLSGFYVRGGGPDQNLFLLDEAPVYNPLHLFGLFSTFNGDIIKDVKLYKGGFPSEYGGKLSSVLDIRTREGNRKQFSASGGLGLISSRLLIEGPIVKDRSSFLVAGRRTYFDVITRIINRVNEDNPNFRQIPDYHFTDLNVSANYDFSDKDQIYFSGFWGRDKFKFASDDFRVDFSWGNTTAGLRWNHIFSPKVFLKTSATYSAYDYKIENRFSFLNFELTSGIQDYNFKSDLFITPNPQNSIKLGVSGIHHRFTVGRFNATSDSDDFNFASGNDLQGNEFGAYYSHEYKPNALLTLSGGLRLSAFENRGTFYWGLEPRFSGKLSLSDRISAKGSFTRTYQYLHMVSNSGASLPTDIWYPSTENIRPQQGDQLAGGLSFLFGKDFLLTTEGYYKWQRQQIAFRDGAQIFVNPNLDEEFVFGRGWGYGSEILLEKRNGNTRGWIGYTLSWTWRQFDDINEGRRFHPRYDRRHDVSVVAMQDLGKRWTLAGTFVYGTGNAVSLPIGRYWTQDHLEGRDPNNIPVYTERNGFRMPSFHVMSLSARYDFLPKWGEASLKMDLYNVYNRRNPFFIYYDTLRDMNGNPNGFVAKQVSLIPILPTLTFDFKI